MPRVRMNVADALNSPETVRAAAVLRHVHEAMELLTTLPPPIVEAVRDRFEEMANEPHRPARCGQARMGRLYPGRPRRRPAAGPPRDVQRVPRFTLTNETAPVSAVFPFRGIERHLPADRQVHAPCQHVQRDVADGEFRGECQSCPHRFTSSSICVMYGT